MAKPISLKKYRSGTGDILECTNQFVYRVEAYKLTYNSYELVKSIYVTSPEYLNIKPEKVIEQKPGVYLTKEIELVGAPQEYLINNNYKLIEK